MLNKSEKDQLSHAKNTSSVEDLKKLLKSQYMNVRRAVARNVNVTTEIANTLVLDPVLNVSYMATKNPRSTTSRTFNKAYLTGCVMCEQDERRLDCIRCEYGKNS